MLRGHPHLSRILAKYAYHSGTDLLHIQQLGQACLLALQVILESTDVEGFVDLAIASYSRSHLESYPGPLGQEKKMFRSEDLTEVQSKT